MISIFKLLQVIFVICERLVQLTGKSKGRRERRNSKAVIMEMASSAFNNRPGTMRQTPSTLSVQSIPSNHNDVSYDGLGSRSRSMEMLNVDPTSRQNLRAGYTPNLSMTNRRSRSSQRDRDHSDSEDSEDDTYKNRKGRSRKSDSKRDMNGSYGGSRLSGSSQDADQRYSDDKFDPRCLAVLEAMIQTEFSEEIGQKVEKYKVMFTLMVKW